MELSGEDIRWILGSLGGIAAAMLGIWWRVESRQDKKIDDLSETNGKDHEILHKKIDKLRDKVEDIWKHLVERK